MTGGFCCLFCCFGRVGGVVIFIINSCNAVYLSSYAGSLQLEHHAIIFVVIVKYAKLYVSYQEIIPT